MESMTRDGRGFTSERRLAAVSMAAHLSDSHPEALAGLLSPSLDQLRVAHGKAHMKEPTQESRECLETWALMHDPDLRYADPLLKGDARLNRERLARLAALGREARRFQAEWDAGTLIDVRRETAYRKGTPA